MKSPKNPRKGRNDNPRETSQGEFSPPLEQEVENFEPPVDRESKRFVSSQNDQDPYTIQCHYDRANRKYVFTVLEFPEISASASYREQALLELENLIQDRLYEMERRNEEPPIPIYLKEYPTHLDLDVSQGLYRKLDVLSKQEKIELKKLAVELLTTALAERNVVNRSKRQPPAPSPNRNMAQQPQPQSHRRDRDRNGTPRRGRGYHDSMQSSENFIDYVRKLEKGGGRGGWRK